MFININLLGVCCCFLELGMSSPPYHPSSFKHFLRDREKAQGFVASLLWGCGRSGRDGLSPSASLRGPFGRRQIVWAASPGDGGVWLPPSRGQERPGSQREARPERPPPLLQAGEETAEGSPIGEPFISLFFTVISPSARCERGSRQ